MSKESDKKSKAIIPNELMIEIVDEAKKLAKNETSSCYDLIMKTKELIKLEKIHVQ